MRLSVSAPIDLSRRRLFQYAAAVAAGAAAARARPAAAAAGSWERVPPVEPQPPPRRDHSFTYAPTQGLFYLFGGQRQRTTLGDLWSFDPQTGTWRELAAMGEAPAARLGHNVAFDSLRGWLVVAFGQAGDRFFNDVWAFDTASETWLQLVPGGPDGPAPRYGAGGAHDVAGDRLFVSHGFTDHGRFDDTWAFDLAAGVWQRVETAGEAPEKRCLGSAFWDPATARLFLYGGQSDRSPFLGDFWSLDPVAGAWTAHEPPPPGARNLYGADFDHHTARWLVFGGNTPTGLAADLWSFDPAAAVWTDETAAPAERPAPRQSPAIAAGGGHLYLAAGRDRAAERDDLWSLAL